MNLSFWNGKRVFLTGHTGFKGAWLSRILTNAGAELTGYSLEPSTEPNLYSVSGIDNRMTSVIGDIRNIGSLSEAFLKSNPEIVIHMAAQPLVRESYRQPAYTYDVNVMGTVNILECIRLFGKVKSFLNVTTDKVYQNNEWEWGYRENDPLDGFDPYSNSKSCSELVTHSYKNSFFNNGETAASTARAGNVIGGGDFAPDRIVPDCVRSAMAGSPIIVRNPYSTRPYEHVLEPLFAYLLILQCQYEDGKYSGYYNVGPDDNNYVTTGQLVTLFCQLWGEGLSWENQSVGELHEATLLKLDCSRMKMVFHWSPRWNLKQALSATIDWARGYMQKNDIGAIMDQQIQDFCAEDGRDV